MSIKTKTSLPLLALVVLAALSIPRVVMHDLKLADFDSPVYKFLAIAPLVIWLIVAIVLKTSRPFYDFLILGLIYGVLLGLTHQVLWDASWDGNLPHLGGNLEGKFDPAVEVLVLRSAALISSIMTGLITGVAFGLIALLSSKFRQKFLKK